MIVMIDTGTCNLRSVGNAFRRIGAPIMASADAKVVAAAAAIVLPGVGAFERGMAGLRDFGLIEILKTRVVGDGVPLIGICLGMQLLADESDEHGRHAGLGLIGGRVERLNPREAGCPVPNIGWCDTRPIKACTLFPDLSARESFYHVHSYWLRCAEPADVAAEIDYGGERVTIAVERGNILGVQFHPEKSQDSGLDLLHRFIAQLRAERRLSA
jgi:glutamine amidotransferase